MRTLIGIIVIGIQVTLILTLVGLKEGTLSDQATRARGVGADIMVRPPSSSVINMSGDMPAGIATKIDQQPHVKISTGVLQQGTDLFNYVTGLDLAQFNKLSGGFHFLSGGPFQHPDDVMIDEFYAKQHNYHVGDTSDADQPSLARLRHLRVRNADPRGGAAAHAAGSDPAKPVR